MRPAALIALLMICSPIAHHVSAQEGSAKPELVRLQLTSNRSVVGAIVHEEGSSLDIIDLKTGQKRSYETGDIASMRRNISEDEAVRGVGLPEFLAWEIQRSVPRSRKGKIADVTPAAVYVTIGTGNGAEVGQKLLVLRDEGELRDPDTNEVIAKRRKRVAHLEVIEANRRYSKAKILGDLETELQIGDEVQSEVAEKKVAILPIVDTNANETADGKALAERITTLMVNRDLPLVERTLLGKVLAELSLQQTKAFDADAARKVGQQLGAFAVLSGTLVPTGPMLEAHVRLIRVDTGEILAATSGRFRPFANNTSSPQTTSRTKPGVALVTLKRPYPESYAGARTDRMSVQYAVKELARQAGLAYDFKTSYANTDPICKRYVQPRINSQPLSPRAS